MSKWTRAHTSFATPRAARARLPAPRRRPGRHHNKLSSASRRHLDELNPTAPDSNLRWTVSPRWFAATPFPGSHRTFVLEETTLVREHPIPPGVGRVTDPTQTAITPPTHPATAPSTPDTNNPSTRPGQNPDDRPVAAAGLLRCLAGPPRAAPTTTKRKKPAPPPHAPPQRPHGAHTWCRPLSAASRSPITYRTTTPLQPTSHHRTIACGPVAGHRYRANRTTGSHLIPFPPIEDR